MTRQSTSKTIKEIGEKLKEEREKRNWKVTKISELSGLNHTTVNNFEDGTDTHLSTFLEYCFALELQPKQILDMQMEISPRFPDTDDNSKKFGYTSGVNILIKDGFLNSWKSARQIKDALEEKFKVELASKNVSSVLGKLVKNESIIINRENKPYSYKKNSN